MWDRDRHCEEFRRQGCIIQQDIFKCCLLPLAGLVFQRGGKESKWGWRIARNSESWDRELGTPRCMGSEAHFIPQSWVCTGLGKATRRSQLNGVACHHSSPPAHPPLNPQVEKLIKCLGEGRIYSQKGVASMSISAASWTHLSSWVSQAAWGHNLEASCLQLFFWM